MASWLQTAVAQRCTEKRKRIHDGKVVRETDYFSQTFEAPDSRAQWVTKL